MSQDRLAQLHDALRQPLRQKILLQLGQNDNLTIDDFAKNLKINDLTELSNQLAELEDLTVEGEHLVSKQSNLRYRLTETTVN